jgi:hypothetical protein
MWHHNALLSIRPWLMTWHIKRQWWKHAHLNRIKESDKIYKV